MPVGPVGNVIYANQVMHLQASKQIDHQNSIQMQNALAAAALNEKESEVGEVKPAEETYKIDPEKEHDRQKNDEESGATEEQIKKESHEKEEDEEKPLHVGLLDIKA